MPFSWRLLRTRLAYAALGLFILGLSGGLMWAIGTRDWRVDLSATGRHSLTAASLAALREIKGPLTITAYVPPKHRARPVIAELAARYRKALPTLKLQFVDPTTISDLARAEGLADGELIVAANGHTEHVTDYTEASFTQALMRLMQTGTQWIAFVSGHGERSPSRGANFDVTHWAEVLHSRGYHVQEINLGEHAAVPDNTSLLVIASPQLDYLPGEINLIADYVARGGALLWLAEPAMPASLNGLAATLGFERLPATVIDPVTQALSIDNPAIAVVTKYPAHAALRTMTAATLLPFATPLKARPPRGWQATTLLETNAKAWGEHGTITGNVAFNPGTDIAGPLVLGLALTHSRHATEQRVIVLGDGDFLSNTYIGNGGNQDLGTHLVDWLVTNENLLAIETRVVPDVGLDLTRWQQAVIGLGFLVVLPGAFALNGAVLGWRRRRA